MARLVFRTLASILLLGQVVFEPDNEDSEASKVFFSLKSSK